MNIYYIFEDYIAFELVLLTFPGVYFGALYSHLFNSLSTPVIFTNFVLVMIITASIIVIVLGTDELFLNRKHAGFTFTGAHIHHFFSQDEMNLKSYLRNLTFNKYSGLPEWSYHVNYTFAHIKEIRRVNDMIKQHTQLTADISELKRSNYDESVLVRLNEAKENLEDDIKKCFSMLIPQPINKEKKRRNNELMSRIEHHLSDSKVDMVESPEVKDLLSIVESNMNISDELRDEAKEVLEKVKEAQKNKELLTKIAQDEFEAKSTILVAKSINKIE